MAGEPGRLFLGTDTSSRALDKVLDSLIEAELDARLRAGFSSNSPWLPRRPRGFALVWYIVLDIWSRFVSINSGLRTVLQCWMSGTVITTQSIVVAAGGLYRRFVRGHAR